MISDAGMRDLTVGQVVKHRGSGDDAYGGGSWSVKTIVSSGVALCRIGGSDEGDEWDMTKSGIAELFSLAVPVHRISEGFYRHRAAGHDDVYYVKCVAILDEDGHGMILTPRQVVYESTRSVRGDPRLAMIRSECEFGQLVTWPDGIVRPRFVRMEYSK